MNNEKNKSKLKIVIIILIITVIVMLFLLLGVINKKKDISRTIMIYMVGSNLESEAQLSTIDLNSLDYDKVVDDKIKVVLIAGGSKKWHNSYIDVNETSIYELTKDGFQKVKKQDIQNMGDSKVLSNFLDYAFDNYKSDAYDLIFWNHGGALAGSENDELSNDLLSITDLKKGLADSKFSEKNKFENIIFRTCLNGTIEYADIFKSYAHYLVASEEVTIGVPNSSVLNFINDIESTDNDYDVAYKFISAYKKQVNDAKTLYQISTQDYIYSTYSIVDLTKIDKLEIALNDFFSDIDLSKNYNNVSKVRSNLYQYALDSSDDNAYDMVDLYNLVDNIKDLSPAKGNDLLDSIEEAVKYNWATDQKSRGMSIYFPYNAENKYKEYFLNIYSDISSLKDYKTFINSFYLIQKTPTKQYFNNNIISINNTKKADFTIELTDEQKEVFAKAKYYVFLDNGDGYYNPVYVGFTNSLDGNKLNATIRDKQLIIKSTIDDQYRLVLLVEMEETEDYIKYQAPVILEYIGPVEDFDIRLDRATATLIYDKKNNKVDVGNIVLEAKKELEPSNVVADLNNYTHIIIGGSKYKILDENGNFMDDWESNGIFEGFEEKIGKYKFEVTGLDPENNYYCVFKIWDTNNNTYYTKLIKMN